MKLIQAVKSITEAGLTPEMRYSWAGEFSPESLSLFGIRRWVCLKGYTAVE